jgi:hypothetical protein
MLTLIAMLALLLAFPVVHCCQLQQNAATADSNSQGIDSQSWIHLIIAIIQPR